MVQVNGSIATSPDGYVVTLTAASEFAPERIWNAVTNPSDLAEWLGKISAPIAAGNAYELHFADGSGHTVRGTVEEVDAPHRAVLGWTLDDHPATRVVIDLPARGNDGTDVTVSHLGIPLEHVVSYAAAWQTHLEFLSRYLHGRLVMFEGYQTRVEELVPGYEAQVEHLIDA